MTKLKASIWLLLLIVAGTPIGYVGYLNQSYFLDTNSLILVLEKPVSIDYSSPEITNMAYWAGCIILTWLIISIVRLPKYFKNRKRIKLLEEQIASQKVEIAHLSNAQTDTPVNQSSVAEQTETTEEPIDEVTEATEGQEDTKTPDKPAQ
jgi:hypothetical protein